MFSALNQIDQLGVVLAALNVLPATVHVVVGAVHEAGIVLAALDIKPNTSLPGTNEGKRLTGGFMTWALIGAIAGLIAGGLTMALGNRTGNHGMHGGGKAAIWASLGVAFLVGAAPKLIEFFQEVGTRF